MADCLAPGLLSAPSPWSILTYLMVHLNYAINIWLFLNNKGSPTTSRHKRRDDKEKALWLPYGRLGVGEGVGGGSVWSSRARRRGPARPSGRGGDSTLRLLLRTPHLHSQVFAKISRWGDICLRGFWRTIERVLVVEPDERRSATPVVFCRCIQ